MLELIYPKSETMISIQQLYKTYQRGTQSVQAICGIDLEIKKGEFVVILGPSGGGKSTLAAVLAGASQTGATLHQMTVKPDAGAIVAQTAVPILPDDTAFDVFGKVTVVTVNGGPMDINNFLKGNLDFALSQSPGLHAMICAANLIAFMNGEPYQTKI